MTNEEFYKDDLKRIVINTLGVEKETGEPTVCSCMRCQECLFEPHECDIGMEDWLQSEHIDKVDWSKVKVDTPIYVRDNVKDSNGDKEEWYPRHFAKFENGKVHAWTGGGTSFTTKKGENSCYEWNYAKLAEN